MKKGMAILGALLLAAGLGLSWVGHAMGGATQATVHLFGREWNVDVTNSVRWDRVSIASINGTAPTANPPDNRLVAPTHAFSSVTVDLDLGDVTIAAGDDYLVDVSYWGKGYEVRWSNSNGELQIWSEKTWGATGAIDCGSNITVYVPAGASLEFVYAGIDLGDLTLSGLTVQNLDADLDLGDMTGEGLTVYGPLNADLDLGNATLYGDLGEVADITAKLGSVTLGLSRPADQYCWDLTADLGAVTVDGRKIGSGVSSSVTGGTGSRMILVDADLGGIDVTFDCVQEVIVSTAIEDGVTYVESDNWNVHAAPTVPSAPAAPAAPTPPSVAQSGG